MRPMFSFLFSLIEQESKTVLFLNEAMLVKLSLSKENNFPSNHVPVSLHGYIKHKS